MPQPILKDVTIVERLADDGNYFLVSPIWEGVDRPDTGGYSCGRNMALARRLVTAIKSGKIWMSAPQKMVDVDGNSYINANIRISMRRANSELRKFGF